MFGCRLSGCFVVCLEDSTERSESNPGRSLGIDKVDNGDCLEDSTLILLACCLVVGL